VGHTPAGIAVVARRPACHIFRLDAAVGLYLMNDLCIY
jgi:hypothetical protein